ncbi:zeta toxin family protein [Thiomicrospira sp. R3]|uniref:zeta toxin family protein n=1 Tax=Thiomicrospira sp. R3 TaxID=3035472 RepID=UPI00259BAA49|nr:zeta toxin family protein [Thiomicrospira sp. R3]WFE68609.1 zeta toxin family protein [Thiomicrospira sp. R3]
MSKELTIIAGPKGAGKTTFAMQLIDEGIIQHFINADEIAKSLVDVPTELRNIHAGKLFLQRLNTAIELEQTVCFETTLSGLSYLKRIKNLKQKGWTVTLYYLALENVNLSKQRVEERVLHGGHNIPAQDIERRFPKSVYNLYYHYIEAVDSVYCYLNMSAPQLIFSKKQGEVVIANYQHYENLKGIADGYHRD